MRRKASVVSISDTYCPIHPGMNSCVMMECELPQETMVGTAEKYFRRPALGEHTTRPEAPAMSAVTAGSAGAIATKWLAAICWD
jgi:hypothetical protein